MKTDARRPALPLVRLAAVAPRRAAGARAAGVRDAAGGGLRARQAARHGLRDDHRPRHDRRRARDRRPPRRVRLRGADGLVQGRAAGRSRPLLRASSPEDHEWLQRNATTSSCAPSTCTAATSRARSRTPSTRSPRRSARATAAAWRSCSRVWETRNGSRARELNLPAAIYIETHGGTGVGGSDDHAGVDIGRTWTETPPAVDRRKSSCAVRGGRPTARGAQGSAAKWAHAAMALTIRALRRAATLARRPRPARGADDGRARDEPGRRARGRARGRPRPGRRPRAAARLARRGRPGRCPSRSCSRCMQDDGFSHAELYRRARRRTSATCVCAVEQIVARLGASVGDSPAAALAAGLFSACIPAIPYAPAAAFLGREKGKLAASRRRAAPGRAGGRRRRRDARRDPHARRDPRARGARLRGRGDRHRRERRPPAARGRRGRRPVLRGPEGRRAEPAGHGRDARRGPLRPGPPLLPRPGRGRRRADRPDRWSCRWSAPTTRSSAPTPGCAPATSGCGRDGHGAGRASTASARVVLSPSESADESLRGAGRAPERDRALGSRRRRLALRPRAARPRSASRASSTVLYAGRLTKEKGADLLADSFLAARERDPRLHLRAGRRRPRGGHAARAARRARDASSAGSRARRSRGPTRAPTSSCSPARPTRSARSCSRRRPAGCRWSPSNRGRAGTLIEDGRTGLLREARAQDLADAVCELAGSPVLRRRLSAAALTVVRARTWERALEQLSQGYGRALADADGAAAAAPMAA